MPAKVNKRTSNQYRNKGKGVQKMLCSRCQGLALECNDVRAAQPVRPKGKNNEPLDNERGGSGKEPAQLPASNKKTATAAAGTLDGGSSLMSE